MIYWGLMAFLILVYWRPQDAIHALEHFRPVLIVMGGTLFFWLAERLKNKDFGQVVRFPLDSAIIGFFFAVVISTYNYHWLRYSLDMFIEFFKIIIFFLLIATCVDSRKRMDAFFGTLSFLTFLIAGIAVLQKFGIDIYEVGMVKGRIQGVGIYQNPNYLAYSIAMVIPIQYYIFRKIKFLPLKIINLCILLTSYICVLFTKSRGGLLCVLGTSVFMLAQRKRPIVKYMVLLSGVLLLFALLATGPRFNTFGKHDDTIQARVEAWYSGFNMLKEHPVIGVGVGCFNEYYKPKTAHSSFVLAGAETGLVGLFMWIAIIYFAMKLLKGSKPGGHFGEYSMALEAAIVSYIICAFSVTFSYRITFFIICGLVSALARLELTALQQKGQNNSEENRLFIEKATLSKTDFTRIGIIELFLVFMWHLIIKFRY